MPACPFSRRDLDGTARHPHAGRADPGDHPVLRTRRPAHPPPARRHLNPHRSGHSLSMTALGQTRGAARRRPRFNRWTYRPAKQSRSPSENSPGLRETRPSGPVLLRRAVGRDRASNRRRRHSPVVWRMWSEAHSRANDSRSGPYDSGLETALYISPQLPVLPVSHTLSGKALGRMEWLWGPGVGIPLLAGPPRRDQSAWRGMKSTSGSLATSSRRAASEPS